MDIPFRRPEHAVLVKVRFPHPQLVTSRQHPGKVSEFIPGILNHEQDIDDGFGTQPRHRGRSNMFDPERCVAQRLRNDIRVSLKLLKPARIVIHDLNSAFLDATDQAYLLRLSLHNTFMSFFGQRLGSWCRAYEATKHPVVG